MINTILITGATDGIGLATAKRLSGEGHTILLHGRAASKLEAARQEISSIGGVGRIYTYIADLSDLDTVSALAEEIGRGHSKLDILVNNAGVFKTPNPITPKGLDVRFVVNTLAPYRLKKKLLPLMNSSGRVVNVSSAAQTPVNLEAMTGRIRLKDMEAYAQSKLAITMWTVALAADRTDGPIFVAVNPGSLLASKMVRDGFGVSGKDIGIGANILCRAALSEEFASANGQYFDNDAGQFALPHPEAMARQKREQRVRAIEALIA